MATSSVVNTSEACCDLHDERQLMMVSQLTNCTDTCMKPLQLTVAATMNQSSIPKAFVMRIRTYPRSAIDTHANVSMVMATPASCGPRFSPAIALVAQLNPTGSLERADGSSLPRWRRMSDSGSTSGGSDFENIVGSSSGVSPRLDTLVWAP